MRERESERVGVGGSKIYPVSVVPQATNFIDKGKAWIIAVIIEMAPDELSL